MWMLRLLPGMGPGPEKPAPAVKTSGNKIKIKPSAALPPQNVNAKTIVQKFHPQIEALHRATKGRLDLIHAVFCQISETNGKPPMPPQILFSLLELTPEDVKEQPVFISDVTLIRGFEKMVKPDDGGDSFYEKVITVIEVQVKRSMHAETEIEKLKPAFLELHNGCKGASKQLFAFFMELLPEDQRQQYSFEMWITMVMKMPPTSATIPLAHFTEQFRDAMDVTDTAEAIIPKVQKHIELNKDPAAAAAAAEELEKASAAAMAAMQQAGGAAAAAKAPPPAPTAQAMKVVDGFKSDLEELHDATGGRVSQLHVAFNLVAEANQKPRIPPPAMGSLLELSKEDLAQNPVKVSQTQLMRAMYKMARPEETTENFQDKVITVLKPFTARCKHAQEQIKVLRPALAELHAACKGAAAKLFEFFMDLMPEEQRPTLTLPQWCGLVMKVNPQSTEIQLEQFILSFQDSFDESDKAEIILPVLQRHIQQLKDAVESEASTPAERKDETKEEEAKEEAAKEAEAEAEKKEEEA